MLYLPNWIVRSTCEYAKRGRKRWSPPLLYVNCVSYGTFVYVCSLMMMRSRKVGCLRRRRKCATIDMCVYMWRGAGTEERARAEVWMGWTRGRGGRVEMTLARGRKKSAANSFKATYLIVIEPHLLVCVCVYVSLHAFVYIYACWLANGWWYTHIYSSAERQNKANNH